MKMGGGAIGGARLLRWQFGDDGPSYSLLGIGVLLSVGGRRRAR